MMKIEVNYTRTNIFGEGEIITDVKMNGTYNDLCKIIDLMSHTEEADKYVVDITHFDKPINGCHGISFYYDNKDNQNNRNLNVTYFYDNECEEYIQKEEDFKEFIREA